MIQRQRLFDRLNFASEALRKAIREKIRAQEQEDYWREQERVINEELAKERVN